MGRADYFINVYWDPDEEEQFLGVAHSSLGGAQFHAAQYNCRCLYRVRVRLR